MKIIWYELKKIWNWKIIGLLILIAILFYHMFLYYPIEHFRSNHPHIEGHDLAVEMTERYGTTLSEDELEEFLQEEKYINEREFETIVETSPVFEEAGIVTFEDYQSLNNKFFEGSEELTAEEEEALDILHNDEQTDYSLYKRDRINAIMEDQSYTYGSNSILDSYTFETTVNYIGQLAVLTLLLSLVLVSPLVVKDRTRNIHFLQYTSKNGRKILKQQLIAVLLSAVVLTTVAVIVFGRLILRNDLLVFWNNGVDSFLNSRMSDMWFHLTFGEYISLALLLIYFLNISLVLLAFVISRYSQNRISMIMKLIPLFAVFAAFGSALFNWMLSPSNRLYRLLSLVGLEGILTAVLFVIAASLMIFSLKREKRIDIY